MEGARKELENYLKTILANNQTENEPKKTQKNPIEYCNLEGALLITLRSPLAI